MRRPKLQALVRREAVVHLTDGQNSIRGFLKEFYEDGSILLAKPLLEAPDAKDRTALGGEALIFRNQIQFIQLLGSGDS